ncbi:hypothetical protein GCM10023216_00910 [Isoptericola chiayiensis]|uniref:DUF4097 domain-containing protein n=1 Tax=Isoptericola chiayiensis TaxID=579446 RepID=A0ABP8Y0C9_9MICO|nr:DUF4097 family beta strand repeat-containing protein [Isoptericola chiayiensis]NOW01346.1 hypothetical protein [Isoptericola chiayiensis]
MSHDTSPGTTTQGDTAPGAASHGTTAPQQGPPPGGPPSSAGDPPAPDPRRSGLGRALLGIGVVVAALMVAWGALHLVDWALTDTRTTSETHSAAAEVELVADGDVTVRSDDDVTDVSVEVVSRGGLTEPRYSVDTVGDTLVLENTCPTWVWWSWTCAGELHAVVPPDIAVTVRTSNGEVRAEGLAGDVDLDSSNGSVLAADLDGDLRAHTRNGDVEVGRIGGSLDVRTSNGGVRVTDAAGDAVVGTDNGDVELRDVGGDAEVRTANGWVEVSGVAGDVLAETSNGDVTVTGDGEPVALTIETSNGERTVEGPTDPAAPRTVEIHSSNGDVTYLGP